MEKTRTTINVTRKLLSALRDSGVGNVSAYLERLAWRDLKRLEGAGEDNRKRRERLLGELEEVRAEWKEYMSGSVEASE